MSGELVTTLKRLFNGDKSYRYSHSGEIVFKPKPSSMPTPKQRPKLTEDERNAITNDLIKQRAQRDAILREFAEKEDNYVVSKRLPRIINPLWKPHPKRPHEARNERILEYNKIKSPPIPLDMFMVTTDELTPEELSAQDDELVNSLERLITPMFDFEDADEYYMDDHYLPIRPFINLFLIDIFKILTPPTPLRYWAADWTDYGSYHYPKRTYFATREEKQQYRQIQDWTLPKFDFRTMFLPNGRLNMDYQPPPWELPVPVALSLPHLDDKVNGVRMFDVYTMMQFKKTSINLLDVHREFVKVWTANVQFSPYITQMFWNARVRAHYNLRGPSKNIRDQPWHNFSTTYTKIYHFIVRLFFNNNIRRPKSLKGKSKSSKAK